MTTFYASYSTLLQKDICESESQTGWNDYTTSRKESHHPGRAVHSGDIFIIFLNILLSLNLSFIWVSFSFHKVAIFNKVSCKATLAGIPEDFNPSTLFKYLLGKTLTDKNLRYPGQNKHEGHYSPHPEKTKMCTRRGSPDNIFLQVN